MTLMQQEPPEDGNVFRVGGRVLNATLDNFGPIARALSSTLRVDMMKALLLRPMNVNEIADEFGLPQSTAASNIKKLEDAGLIVTELVPGLRGTQKVCYANVHRIVVDTKQEVADVNTVTIPMPIGGFVDCEVAPPCGLTGPDAIIGEFDDPASFYDPGRVYAQLLWFKKGYVEYRFPRRIPKGAKVRNLRLTMELCSEAPMHNPDWPSDITVWVNQQEIGTWTSPGDFGGERGYLTPEWWETYNTQFGVLKEWRVSEKGSFVDGRQVSDMTIRALRLDESPYIAVRIGVKADATHVGGVNLFGRRFGNYDTDLTMRIDFSPKPSTGGSPSQKA